MLEAVVLLSLCLLLGLLSLAVVIWVVATGRIAYLDGIALALIGLTLAVFFIFNLAWSFYTGELQELLKSLRKRWAQSEDSDDSSAGHSDHS